jgi:hypothetical protein
MPPTTQAVIAIHAAQVNLERLEENWIKIKTIRLPELNDELKKAGLHAIII